MQTTTLPAEASFPRAPNRGEQASFLIFPIPSLNPNMALRKERRIGEFFAAEEGIRSFESNLNPTDPEWRQYPGPYTRKPEKSQQEKENKKS